MIPPSFSDLGKAAKDLFDKKYVFGNINVECISKKEGRSLTVKTSHDNNSKELSGNVEFKHSTNCGIDTTCKWLHKNVLSAEISKTYESCKGYRSVSVFTSESDGKKSCSVKDICKREFTNFNSCIFTFEPDTGKKSLKLKESFKREYLNFNSEFLFNSCKPDVNVNLVLGCSHPKPYLAGVDFTIDTKDHTLKNHTFALGCEKSDFGALVTMKDISLFNTYVYQKISNHADIGVHVTHNKNTKETKYGIAGQYNIPDSDNSFVKAKVNQDTLIGLAYGCTLNNGVQLTLSAEIDGKKLDTGPHNFGVGLVYEP